MELATLEKLAFASVNSSTFLNPKPISEDLQQRTQHYKVNNGQFVAPDNKVLGNISLEPQFQFANIEMEHLAMGSLKDDEAYTTTTITTCSGVAIKYNVPNQRSNRLLLAHLMPSENHSLVDILAYLADQKSQISGIFITTDNRTRSLLESIRDNLPLIKRSNPQYREIDSRNFREQTDAMIVHNSGVMVLRASLKNFVYHPHQIWPW